MTGEGVRVRAPGKINLSLGVGRRREDGFHPLSTVFQAVSLYEEVTASPAPELMLTVTGAQAERVPLGEANLAWRAARLLADTIGLEPLVHLHIHKGVPVAGGMAGGSADAAATLVACDALWGTGLSRPELSELAAELGADVPFALLGHTAVGSGRGDVLSPAMSRGRYHWALVLRDEGLSTPAVFARFDEIADPLVANDPKPDRDLLAALRTGDPELVGRALGNDLEPAALDLAPELVETARVAEEAGALGVVVSGSGPTVAVLGRSPQHALALQAALTAAGVADRVIGAHGPVPGARIA